MILIENIGINSYQSDVTLQYFKKLKYLINAKMEDYKEIPLDGSIKNKIYNFFN
jgi:hypothetical protein